MSRKNVTDPQELASRTEWNAISQSSIIDDSAILDMSGLIRDHGEAANEGGNDEIVMDPALASEVRKVFSAVGFPMPTRWNELRSNLLYLERFNVVYGTYRGGFGKRLDVAERFVRKAAPELMPAVKAMEAGGQAALAKFHRSRRTFQANARKYREWVDLDGWCDSEGGHLIAPELEDRFKKTRPIRSKLRRPQKKTALDKTSRAGSIKRA